MSQARLARMVGVSRATLNYAEQGRSAVGADVLLGIMQVLGMAIVGPRDTASASVTAFDLLAASASVSFVDMIGAADIERAFAGGMIEQRWVAHLATVVDEAPDSLLVRAVRELAIRTSTPASRIWRNVEALAGTLASPNPRWA